MELMVISENSDDTRTNRKPLHKHYQKHTNTDAHSCREELARTHKLLSSAMFAKWSHDFFIFSLVLSFICCK